MTSRFNVFIGPGDRHIWHAFGERMLELERAEWRERAFSREEVRRQATSARSVVATIEQDGELVGFAVAMPEAPERATLNNVLIDRAHRGKGLVWRMLAALERELRERGYEALVIDARIDNGFADAVEEHYGASATVLAPDHPSEYGPQRTIEVTLGKRARAPGPRRAYPNARGSSGRNRRSSSSGR